MTGRLEALDTAVVGHVRAAENLRARRWAVGLMIGIQAVVGATDGAAIAKHQTPNIPKYLIVQPDQPVAHVAGHHHKHHHSDSHRTHKPEQTSEVKSAPTQPTSDRQAETHVSPSSQPIREAIGHLKARLHQPTRGQFGADISWPNKRTVHLPNFVGYMTLGLNDGDNFSVNPLLRLEADRFANVPHELYVNSDFNGMKHALKVDPHARMGCGKKIVASCVAWGYGYDAGVYDIELAKENHVYNRHIKIDIEPEYSRPWSKNLAANAQSLQGELTGLRAMAHGERLPRPKFELYSTPTMFRNIAGGWMPGLPIWLATGHRPDMNFARARCQDDNSLYGSFGGGRIAEVQSVLHLPVGPHHRKIDIDVSTRCPQPYQ